MNTLSGVFPRLSHPYAPRFGWGGKEASGEARPLPKQGEYRLTLRPGDLQVTIASRKVTLQPELLDSIYERVFRKDLTGPGFTIISGIEDLVGNDLPKIRAVQMALANQLAQRRNKELNLPEGKDFSLKYMGRANKTKMNPIHCDTKSSDSIVLMIYEPAKDIIAYPFIGDLSQMAQDKGLKPESMMQAAGSMKVHYGKQLFKEFHAEVLQNYALDLPELNSGKIELVILNDSIGSDGAKSKNGNIHGVRHLDITGPNPQRNFNHVVIDVEANSLGVDAKIHIPKSQADTLYLAKAVPAEQRVPISGNQAMADYIENGTIYYRQDSDKPAI